MNRLLRTTLVLCSLLSAVTLAQDENTKPGTDGPSRDPGSKSLKEQLDGRGQGRGKGMGRGFGRGPDAGMRADQDVFHFLLEHHDAIRRDVKLREDGVETLTESDDPEISAKIQEHVAAMQSRMKEGRGLRFWDPVFVALFDNYQSIEMAVENTKNGVRVVETSKHPFSVRLIQAHAVVVTKFVERGFDEAHESHAVPDEADTLAKKTTDAAADLVYPVIEGFGGVVRIPEAIDAPQPGMKMVLDVTADTKDPAEVNKGLDRAARILNLYGAYGLKSSDIKLTVVLHGEATKAALMNNGWEKRFQSPTNPNLKLIKALKDSGVEVVVCGQALHYKKIGENEVASDIRIAAAAFSVLMNRQSAGYSYVPVP